VPIELQRVADLWRVARLLDGGDDSVDDCDGAVLRRADAGGVNAVGTATGLTASFSSISVLSPLNWLRISSERISEFGAGNVGSKGMGFVGWLKCKWLIG